MAKIKSKGTVLAVAISAVYTAIPQLKSISISGAASETYDSTTLDGTVYKTKDPTGYTEPATISAELFRDPDNTTHQFLIALLAAPVATNFKVTYADSTPLEEVYSGVGFGWDTTVAPADGLSSTLTVVTSGAPS